MRRTIATWYDDLREARGLERLGPRARGVGELLSSDLDIRILGLEEAQGLLAPLVDEAEEESIETLPGALAAFEMGRLRADSPPPRTRSAPSRTTAKAGPSASPSGFRTRRRRPRPRADRLPEGTARVQAHGSGTALLGALAKAFEDEGINLVMLDSGLPPPRVRQEPGRPRLRLLRPQGPDPTGLIQDLAGPAEARHVDPAVGRHLDALRLEEGPLELEALAGRQGDAAVLADKAVPGKALLLGARVQDAHDLPRPVGQPRERGDRAVAMTLPARDAARGLRVS